MSKSHAWYASRYIDRYGMHIVPIEPGRKFPRTRDWGKNCLTDSEAATKFFTQNPDWGMGVALGPSGYGSLDIDCWESFAWICECLGIDLPGLLASTPTIRGRGYRIMFRLPEGVNLPYRKINWPAKNDPTGEKHRAAMRLAKEAKDAGDTEREARIRAVAKRWAMFCVFELRSSTSGEKQRQDVLPPTIHPETGQPYRWETQPRADWPEPPRWMLALWQNFEEFKLQMQSMCPWSAQPETPPEPARGAPKKKLYRADIIGSYNSSTDIETELERYGYKRISKNRYLSPHSSTGLPGVILFPKTRNCWIHHASDPLCSEEKGHPVNAFDLFCYYDHNGDVKAAVAAAGKMLGIRSGPSEYEEAAPTASVPATVPTPSVPAPFVPSRQLDSPLPWSTDKGRPLKHIDNLREICRRLGVVIRYNVIKKEEEIIIPGEGFSMDNQGNAALAWLISECSLFEFATDKIGDFITYLADKNQYNPVAEWVGSKPWDGVSRLPDLYNTVTARDESVDPERKSLKETLIRRWMVSAIAGAFSPEGVSAAGVLTFQGAQYLGKTKWFKSLVPSELELLNDGMLLRPDDKDSVKQICSYWLVELGELDSTFRKSDVAQLKAFIGKSFDVLRLAYARRESKFARRTVFFGSVNPREFLHDQTGNRRYWTIECEELDHTHGIDMQQVWAEVHELWKAGESHFLTPDEMSQLNASNDEYMAIDPVEERILTGLNWAEPEHLWRWIQATEVLIECGMDKPSRQDASTAAALIRKRNGGQQRRSNGRNLFLCPTRVNNY